MQYQLARDGQQMGEFSDADLKSGLFEGRFLATDLVWTTGMAEWRPLGEVLGAGIAARAPQMSAWPTAAPQQTNGLAIASLILGILALITCWLGLLFGIPGIVCGHMALSRIRSSGGTLGGRGMAIAGLVMSYVGPLITIVAIGASLTIPAIAKVQEKAEVTKGISLARQAVIACKLHASDNNGAFPESLDALTSSGVLDQVVLDKLNAFKPPGWKGEAGFEYHGSGKSDADDVSKIILVSRSVDTKGKRIVATIDGFTELRVSPEP